MVKLKFVLAALLLALTSHAMAAVQVSNKHIFVLYPGVDSVFGSYIFMVQNPGAQPERLSFPVMLPTETIDFQAQEGLAPNELNLGADGGLTIDKNFPPGDTLITIGFKVPADVNNGRMTLKAAQPFESVGMFVFEGKFQINGPALDIKRNVDFSGRTYDTYTVNKGEAGKTYQMELQGIPEGRGRLWIIGWVLAGTLLAIALALAWFSRPQLPQGAEDTL
ncbi:MAG TPA: hypothetical protein VE954_33000 [Oligoflexus sp.]|uniref:hypothetical protein n=1 Tax=Oligoflexus sp. TaxID=1971216 RepID=UPI002D4D6246|nr:hypothetical protein [Oligoflexus sp.]HYX37944.1 hypothetical protein [Oligoflexus sp.]